MNNTKINSDILRVVDSVKIVSETEYYMGAALRDISRIQIIDPNGAGELNTAQNGKENYAENFFKVLTTDIYNLYNAADGDNHLIGSSDYVKDFVLLLSNANCGKGTFEDGWIVTGEDKESGKIIVKKNSLNYWMDEKNVIAENGTFAVGAKCAVKIGKEVRHLNVHYYQAFGNCSKKDLPDFENKLLRFYWNLTPEGAIKYIKAITAQFNKENIFFRTKVLSTPAAYKRADAGVLYIDHSQLEKALPIVAKIYGQLGKFLKNNVPMFSKNLGKGLGFAEDPADGDSFGISRAKLLAHALYKSFLENRKQKDEILETVVKHFSERKIDSKNPYSSKPSLTNYERIFGDLSF